MHCNTDSLMSTRCQLRFLKRLGLTQIHRGIAVYSSFPPWSPVRSRWGPGPVLHASAAWLWHHGEANQAAGQLLPGGYPKDGCLPLRGGHQAWQVPTASQQVGWLLYVKLLALLYQNFHLNNARCDISLMSNIVQLAGLAKGFTEALPDDLICWYDSVNMLWRLVLHLKRSLTVRECRAGRWLTLWCSTSRWQSLGIAGQSMMERRVCTQPTHCLWHPQGWAGHAHIHLQCMLNINHAYSISCLKYTHRRVKTLTP